MTQIGEMLATRRWCYFIPAEGFVDGHGYRVSIVFEHESGHYPTGDDAWIAGDHAARKPWFWGTNLDEARRACAEINRERLGLSPKDAALIVASSMGAELPAERRAAKRVR
jgi:hypothetical protein